MKISQLFNNPQIEISNLPSMKEGFIRAFAAFIVFLFIPLFILNTVICITKFKAPLSYGSTYDVFGKPYYYPVFNHGKFRHILLLLLIVKGDMTWVGLPRDVTKSTCLNGFKKMKVGLVSLYGLHQFTGISISSIDEDMQRQRQFSNIEKSFLLVRVLLASLAFRTKRLKIETSFRIFGIRIDNVTLDSAVAKIMSALPCKYPKTACFVNVNSFNLARGFNELSDAINDFDFAFADGSGIRIAAQMQGNRLLGNVNGTDMLPLLCSQARSNNKSLFLLGAEPGVAGLTASNLEREYPGLRISGTYHGYFDKKDSHEIIKKINAAKTDILLVAFGSPTQERWLQEHKSMLNVNIAIAVGGLFDFYSGRIARAPVWIRELGMEWVWRLMQEPHKKFHRYVIGNPVFLLRCFFQSKFIIRG